ncbi:MAG: DUF2442 domain-containing protein [Spirochaetia bacterium]|nr:DUF2442 domain-containing protein [Spirochaetia bacterium]
MMLHVDSLELSGSYKMSIWFNNGETVEVDLENELEGEIFEPLKDSEYFKRVYLNEEIGTAQWPNGADFAPEFLLELGRKQAKRSA